MGVPRLLVAFLLLALLGGTAWWLAASHPASDAQAGTWRVVVVGPGGTVLSDRAVASEGTPLAALLQSGAEADFAVEVEEQPWVGTGCTAHYVVAIAGHRESGSGGWNYYTRQPGKPWMWQAQAAGCHALQPGEEVEWCWVEADTCSHHAA